MSLYKREDSPYWWMTLPKIPGEKTSPKRSTRTANKKQAQKMYDKLVAQRWEMATGIKTSDHTWDEAVERYIRESQHKRTLANDHSILKWFYPKLAGKALKDITKPVIDEIARKCAQGVRPSSANRKMALVRVILRKACHDWEWLERVPKVPMLKDDSERIRSLSLEEFNGLKKQLPLHLQDMVIFSVATGLRQANVKNCEWQWITPDCKYLTVPAAQFKTGRVHTIPLSEHAKEVLFRRKGEHPTHVFTYDGKPVVQVNTKAWRNALTRAGIDDFRWHDLRHTFATWHRLNGTVTHELKALGGWKSSEMAERYAHVAPEHLLNAATRLDNMMSITL